MFEPYILAFVSVSVFQGTKDVCTAYTPLGFSSVCEELLMLRLFIFISEHVPIIFILMK